ncbi:MAG TPA: hypothetical protein VKX49_10160 [Bryobacteraceae bacterium]|nr:hypothetical protein [Bryobacteraceae bacterium]
MEQGTHHGSNIHLGQAHSGAKYNRIVTKSVPTNPARIDRSRLVLLNSTKIYLLSIKFTSVQSLPRRFVAAWRQKAGHAQDNSRGIGSVHTTPQRLNRLRKV